MTCIIASVILTRKGNTYQLSTFSNLNSMEAGVP